MQPVTAIFVDEMLPSASIDFFRSRDFLLELSVPGDCPVGDPGGELRFGMALYEDIRKENSKTAGRFLNRLGNNGKVDVVLPFV